MGRGVILIYDYGTTALKTALFDEELKLVDIVVEELHYEYPEHKRVEMDAEKYWELVVASTRQILDRNGCRGSLEIISVTSQAETVIPVDSEGRSLRKAMVWLDNRADVENGHLREAINLDSFYQKTGLNEFGPILPVNKIAWIRRNEFLVYREAYKFLLLKDFILFRLSGVLVSDPSICSCSGCFDINSRKWWEAGLDAAGLDIGKLPEICDSMQVVGILKREVRELFGLKKDVKVMNGLLDQCGSAIGAGNIAPGMLTETTGTAIVAAATVNDGNVLNGNAKVPLLCHGIPGKYLAYSYCATAGILLKWFKDNFCGIEVQKAEKEGINPYRLLDSLVDPDSPVNGRLVLLPHFCGSMVPVNNPNATGILFGLDLNTGKGDLIKAIMESVAFLLKDNMLFLMENGFRFEEVVSLGGGAKSPVWLKIKSQVLDKKVVTLENEESTSFGCAFLAGMAIGLFKSFEEVSKLIRVNAEYLPDGAKSTEYERKYGLYTDLYKANAHLFK